MAGDTRDVDGTPDAGSGDVGIAFEHVAPTGDDSGGGLRDFLFGEPDGGSDTGDTAPKRRGRKPGSKNRVKTFDETETVGESRDVGEDVKDFIRAASKSAVKTFGPQLGPVWELDRTEVTLLASPTTRLIKQTSSINATASVKATAFMLAGIAALITLPRLMITMNFLKAVKAQQQGQQQQVRQEAGRARTAHGFDPLSNVFAPEE